MLRMMWAVAAFFCLNQTILLAGERRAFFPISIEVKVSGSDTYVMANWSDSLSGPESAQLPRIQDEEGLQKFLVGLVKQVLDKEATLEKVRTDKTKVVYKLPKVQLPGFSVRTLRLQGDKWMLPDSNCVRQTYCLKYSDAENPKLKLAIKSLIKSAFEYAQYADQVKDKQLSSEVFIDPADGTTETLILSYLVQTKLGNKIKEQSTTQNDVYLRTYAVTIQIDGRELLEVREGLVQIPTEAGQK